jgi:citrate lyase beta subunit
VLDNQVPALNEGYTPSPEESDAADDQLVTYADATRSGAESIGVAGGRTLTPDIIRQFAHVSALASACAVRDEFKAAAVAGRPIPLP